MLYIVTAAKVDNRGIRQTLRSYVVYAGNSQEDARSEIVREAYWYHDRGFKLLEYTPDYASLQKGDIFVTMNITEGEF